MFYINNDSLEVAQKELQKFPFLCHPVHQTIQHHIPQENILQYHQHLNRKLQQITNYDDAGLLLLWPEL
jgi:predicted metal-dependent RNase